MECPKCKNQLNDNAKFCGKCGTKIEQAAPQPAAENACVKCGNPLKPGAKFCGKCGTQQPASASAVAEPENPTKGYIMWEMQPGQVALRLTEAMFSQYAKPTGVVIPEGYLAMVMCGGKMQAMLEAGIYKFDKNLGVENDPLKRVSAFFSNLLSGRKKANQAQNIKDSEAIAQSVQKRIPVEIVVCRSGNFSLPFTFKNIATKAIRVDVGLLLSLQVANLVALYKNYLIDKTVLPADVFAKELAVHLEESVQSVLINADPEKLNHDPEIKNLLADKLKNLFAAKFDFLQLLDVVKLETGRQELQRLQNLSEEMYLSERELEQLARRNEFMNRLSQEQNSAELQNASNAAEFNRRLAEINRDNLLTQEELANVQRQIQERAQDHDMERARAVELMVIENQRQVQDARIKMEEEMGTRLFNIQMERQRKADDYADERRRKEMDMDKQEQLGQLDLLRQAQDIRQQREQADHNRKLEERKQEQDFEMNKLNVYTSMSAEQIMVANPNITPEAAQAMAAKFKAEAEVAAGDNRARDAQAQMQMMKEFMEQQMQAVRDMASANSQAMAGLMNAKEREIERTQHMMDKNEDRYASVVREQIKSGSNGAKTCSKCGQSAADEQFCPECGSRIE